MVSILNPLALPYQPAPQHPLPSMGSLTPLASFTCFPQLPKELQLEIWEFSLPGPRVVKLRYRGEGADAKCTSKCCLLLHPVFLFAQANHSYLQVGHAFPSPSTSAASPARQLSSSTPSPLASKARPRRHLAAPAGLSSRRYTSPSLAMSCFSTRRAIDLPITCGAWASRI